MSLLAETINDLRSVAMRGIVVAVRDDGQMQLVDVMTHDGATRADIEVYQPFGFAACPVAIGSVALLFAMGADPGDLIAFVVATPGLRFGNQQPGEVTIYGASGARVSFRQGGGVEVHAATTVVISAPGGVEVTGNVTVTGDLTASGNISDSVRSMAADRQIFDAHTHVLGGSVTSTPTPTE